MKGRKKKVRAIESLLVFTPGKKQQIRNDAFYFVQKKCHERIYNNGTTSQSSMEENNYQQI